MPIEQVQNGETGFDARQKINAAIQAINEVLAAGAGDFLPIDGSAPMTGPLEIQNFGIDPNDSRLIIYGNQIRSGYPGGGGNFSIRAYDGAGLGSLTLIMDYDQNPEVYWGQNGYQIFHQGFPPISSAASISQNETANLNQLLWLAECRARHWDMMGNPERVSTWKGYYRELVAMPPTAPLPPPPEE